MVVGDIEITNRYKKKKKKKKNHRLLYPWSRARVHTRQDKICSYANQWPNEHIFACIRWKRRCHYSIGEHSRTAEEFVTVCDKLRNTILSTLLQGPVVMERNMAHVCEHFNFLLKSNNLLSICGQAARERIKKNISLNKREIIKDHLEAIIALLLILLVAHLVC